MDNIAIELIDMVQDIEPEVYSLFPELSDVLKVPSVADIVPDPNRVFINWTDEE